MNESRETIEIRRKTLTLVVASANGKKTPKQPTNQRGEDVQRARTARRRQLTANARFEVV